MSNRKPIRAVADLRAKLGSAVQAARRYRMALAVALGALAAVLLAALVIPVAVPDAGASAARGQDAADPAAARAEDLSAFLASARWGVTLQDIMDEEAARAAAAARAARQIEITRELAEIGFVGLMLEAEESAVLLVLPDGKISRFAGGDTLPDGRSLVSVTDNSLTLEGSDGQQEALSLFPRVRTE